MAGDPAITGLLNQVFNKGFGASGNPGSPGSIQNPQVSFLQPQNLTPTGALAQDQYGLNIYRYPSEIAGRGRTTVPSFITFNIYVPSSSPYAANQSPSLSSVQSASQINSDYQDQTFGKAQAPGQLDATGDVTVGLINFVNNQNLVEAGVAGVSAQAVSDFTNKTVTLKPQLSRIGTSIQLYMPDTVMMSMNHDYSTVSATEAIGNLRWATLVGHGLSDAVKAAWDSAKTNLGELAHISEWGDFGKGIFNSLAASVNQNAATKELAGKAAEASGLVGPGFTDLALRSSGVAVNPQVELIYRGTQNRTFVFEFRFTPRSALESQTINKIIQTFKQFSSPGIQKGSLGRYFIVPGQFDIVFNFQNNTNPFIGKISTCVLEAIDVNYVGQGQWATFPDGSPAEITMMLRFKEAEIIYDYMVQQGY